MSEKQKFNISSKLSLFIIFVIFFSLSYTVNSMLINQRYSREVSAQNKPVPSMFCIGSCPNEVSTEKNQTSTVFQQEQDNTNQITTTQKPKVLGGMVQFLNRFFGTLKSSVSTNTLQQNSGVIYNSTTTNQQTQSNSGSPSLIPTQIQIQSTDNINQNVNTTVPNVYQGYTNNQTYTFANKNLMKSSQSYMAKYHPSREGLLQLIIILIQLLLNLFMNGGSGTGSLLIPNTTTPAQTIDQTQPAAVDQTQPATTDQTQPATNTQTQPAADQTVNQTTIIPPATHQTENTSTTEQLTPEMPQDTWPTGQ